MFRNPFTYLFTGLVLVLLGAGFVADWGFYGHKRITYQAVFSVPHPLHSFLRENLAYLTEQSVAPDKRRMLQKNEDIRHYIDLDHWETRLPIDTLAKNWRKALFQHTTWHFMRNNQVDSSVYPHETLTDLITIDSLEQWFVKSLPFPHDDSWQAPSPLPQLGTTIRLEEHLSQHGINPWALSWQCNRLIKAFEAHNTEHILPLMANISHYVADAHVPLHTTKNYNGQYSNQVGIHAFWETRIPELFSEDFDFMVGRAEYISDLNEYFWKIVSESHAMVPIVLETEKKVRSEMNETEINCFDMRKKMQPLPCKTFAARFEASMNHMVEKRMRAAIRATASVWYTCWVNAGQPDLQFSMPGQLEWLRQGAHFDRKKEN